MNQSIPHKNIGFIKQLGEISMNRLSSSGQSALTTGLEQKLEGIIVGKYVFSAHLEVEGYGFFWGMVSKTGLDNGIPEKGGWFGNLMKDGDCIGEIAVVEVCEGFEEAGNHARMRDGSSYDHLRMNLGALF